MADKNKVKFRLRRAYYAPATVDESTGNITYSTPVRIPGAVSVSFSTEGDIKSLNADGTVYYVSAANNGYSGDFEMALIPDDFRVSVLGETIVETDGIAVETATAQPSPFAFLFEFEGDKKNIRHVMYFCYATRSAVEGENPDSKEAKTEKLTIKAMPRETDDIVKSRTTATTSTTVYDAWYTAVYVPSASAEG